MEVSPAALEALRDYWWPGNVRELENVIERSCLAARPGPIRPEHLPPEVLAPPPVPLRFSIDLTRPLPVQLQELIAEMERAYLRKALWKVRGHVGRCAQLCGLSRRSVTMKLQAYGIPRPPPEMRVSGRA
jgi:DNA-binding NtrC family response regulator